MEERAGVAAANLGVVDGLFKNIFVTWVCDGSITVLICTRNMRYLCMFLLESNFSGAIFLSPLKLSHVSIIFKIYF